MTVVLDVFAGFGIVIGGLATVWLWLWMLEQIMGDDE